VIASAGFSCPARSPSTQRMRSARTALSSWPETFQSLEFRQPVAKLVWKAGAGASARLGPPMSDIPQKNAAAA
jgi:hypothetical protein